MYYSGQRNWVIEKVENLEAELQIPPLGEVEVLQSREIAVENPRAAGDVASSVAVASKRLQRESRDVEPFARSRIAQDRTDAGCVCAIVSSAGLGTDGTRHNRQREPNSAASRRSLCSRCPDSGSSFPGRRVSCKPLRLPSGGADRRSTRRARKTGSKSSAGTIRL